MKLLVATWKLCRGFVHTLRGLFTILLVFPRMNQPQRDARVQSWALEMLRLVDIRLEVRGQPPSLGPLLMVANHISWLDILVLHAARHCRFVSKSELRHWPLIGTLATGAGTLYIERESRRDAMRVVHHMAKSLRDGDILAVFPEGTTSDGRTLLPFHANLIQSAISAQAPVLPVALRFVETKSGEPSFSPCYIGDDTLIGSIWRTLTGPAVTAVVSYGLPQHALGRSRREWAADLRNEVERLRT